MESHLDVPHLIEDRRSLEHVSEAIREAEYEFHVLFKVHHNDVVCPNINFLPWGRSLQARDRLRLTLEPQHSFSAWYIPTSRDS